VGSMRRKKILRLRVKGAIEKRKLEAIN